MHGTNSELHCTGGLVCIGRRLFSGWGAGMGVQCGLDKARAGLWKSQPVTKWNTARKPFFFNFE
jgi:hypothetical protein